MLLKVRPKLKVQLMSRFEWKAHEPRYVTYRRFPLTNVRITSSYTPSCHDPISCTQLVKVLQETYMDSGFDDISHNFLVGGDGRIHEGRGWEVEPSMPEEFDEISEKCLDIALIGDYDTSDPPWNMLYTMLNFLEFGLKQKYIIPAFRLLPYREL